MAFCSNCGTQLNENNVCPSCSAATGQNIAPNQMQGAPTQQNYTQGAPAQQNYAQPGPAQQNYAQPAPAQQNYAQPGPAQQNYAQGAQPQQNYAQGAPTQQYYAQGAPQQQNYQQGAQPQQNYQQGAQPQQNIFQKFTNTTDTTSEYDPRDIADNKIMALLSYLGILVLIPMFAAPKSSRFARYHVKQGFTLFLTYIAYSVVSFLLGLIKVTTYDWFIPIRTTPTIVYVIIWLLGIPLFILSIIGIINAYNGKAKELPLIGKIRILK